MKKTRFLCKKAFLEYNMPLYYCFRSKIFIACGKPKFINHCKAEFSFFALTNNYLRFEMILLTSVCRMLFFSIDFGLYIWEYLPEPHGPQQCSPTLPVTLTDGSRRMRSSGRAVARVLLLIETWGLPCTTKPVSWSRTPIPSTPDGPPSVARCCFASSSRLTVK